MVGYRERRGNQICGGPKVFYEALMDVLRHYDGLVDWGAFCRILWTLLKAQREESHAQ
jgi:hypothetical protein